MEIVFISIVCLFLILVGTVFILASVYNIYSFFNKGKPALIVKIIGVKWAKIYFIILGLFSILSGIAGLVILIYRSLH